MVVREDREKLIQYLNEYIDGKIKSFEFDEKIGSLYHCGDKTVSDIAFDLWFEYDDIRDHKIRATKEQWNYYQRLLVLLGSVTEIIREKERIWHISQIASLFALILLICSSLHLWNFHYGSLILYLLISGFAYLSCRVRSYEQEKKSFSGYKEDCYPFADMSQIRAAVRNIKGFKKRKYTGNQKPGGILYKFIKDLNNEIMLLIFMPLFAPIILFSQIFPISVYKTHIKIPEATAICEDS